MIDNIEANFDRGFTQFTILIRNYTGYFVTVKYRYSKVNSIVK